MSGEFLRVAHASRVLVSASRRNNLFFGFRTQPENGDSQKKFAIASTRSRPRAKSRLRHPNYRYGMQR